MLSEGAASVKIYRGANRGRELFTLVYSLGGQRKRQNFAAVDDAKTEARVVLTTINNGGDYLPKGSDSGSSRRIEGEGSG